MAALLPQERATASREPVEAIRQPCHDRVVARDELDLRIVAGAQTVATTVRIREHQLVIEPPALAERRPLLQDQLRMALVALV